MKSISSEKCSNSTSLYPYRAKSCLIYFCCYIFSPMSMVFLSFFHAYFKHISAYFSGTKPDFDDTSPWFMILRWYFSLRFLEKSHSAKVLNINDIILYLSRKMILWDFFREKLFTCVCRAFLCSTVFCWKNVMPSHIKYSCYWYLYWTISPNSLE